MTVCWQLVVACVQVFPSPWVLQQYGIPLEHRLACEEQVARSSSSLPLSRRRRASIAAVFGIGRCANIDGSLKGLGCAAAEASAMAIGSGRASGEASATGMAREMCVKKRKELRNATMVEVNMPDWSNCRRCSPGS